MRRTHPTPVLGLTGPVMELVPTNGNTYARLADGTVESWGTNVNGELGDGEVSNSPTPIPVRVAGISNAVALARPAIDDHMCVRLADATVHCWGDDTSANFDDPVAIGKSQPSPVLVSALSGASSFTTGTGFMCALFPDGSVQCVGNNAVGQLGTPDTSGNLKFTKIAALPTAVAVTAGHFHTCAVLADRTAMCFGANRGGELGRGTTTDYETVPAPVQNLSNVRSIAPTGGCTCALLFDGTVQCWGGNNDGELGNGTMDIHNHPTPAPVPGLGNVVQLAAGGSHTCVLLSDGRVLCWGYNAHGELGDGTTANRAVPTEVAW